MIPFDPNPVRFALFEFNPLTGELRRQGLKVKLTHQATTLLAMLTEQPLRIRTRDEIQRRLWPSDTFVDFDHSLNKIVHSLREALGDNAASPRFIETVAAQGYRFLPQFAERRRILVHGDTHAKSNSLAVLPICAGQDTHLAALANRVTSRLIDCLSALPEVRVMAERTVKCYLLENASPQRAGQQLGVRSVLTGELTRSDSAIFLRVELIDTTDGAQLCGAHLESPFSHLANFDEEAIAREILHQIHPALAQASEKQASSEAQVDTPLASI